MPKFRKILIANRGEIAVRIIRTARRMGIATVAVYCDVDRDAAPCRDGRRGGRISGRRRPRRPTWSSTRSSRRAGKTGADAVHPGYGFLSERAAFAEALAAAGIAFIGPNAEAIAAMGDKIESKKLAAAARRLDHSRPSRRHRHARARRSPRRCAIGFPVMIKASAGGGGKGMRIARSEGEVGRGLARWRARRRGRPSATTASSSSATSRAPRHIEIQVLGDKHGNVIHLGERECSIQRRNQKIVEEAPSPAVDARLRAEMGAQAVALAKAVGYDSAGTVEFVIGAGPALLLPRDEHAAPGRASGDRARHRHRSGRADDPGRRRRAARASRQDDVRLDGWAIEARLYAEDPVSRFPALDRPAQPLPSAGRGQGRRRRRCGSTAASSRAPRSPSISIR